RILQRVRRGRMPRRKDPVAERAAVPGQLQDQVEGAQSEACRHRARKFPGFLPGRVLRGGGAGIPDGGGGHGGKLVMRWVGWWGWGVYGTKKAPRRGYRVGLFERDLGADRLSRGR